MACSIELGDTVVVTGGQEAGGVPGSRVQEYDTAGARDQLPDLNTARYDHACGHYIKDDKVVNLIT